MCAGIVVAPKTVPELGSFSPPARTPCRKEEEEAEMRASFVVVKESSLLRANESGGKRRPSEGPDRLGPFLLHS